jgi:hypothetical protein
MPTEAEFKVAWHEFHEILHLGGNAQHQWASCALKDVRALERILGKERAAELVVLLETHSNVLLCPIAGSRVSQTRQPKTTPSPPPSFPANPPPSIPLPFPPPLSRAPPKIEVPTHPLSSNAHKAKPAHAFTHARPAWDADPNLLPKKPPGKT